MQFSFYVCLEIFFDWFQDESTEVLGQVPMAHTCNPRYSGGRDQEDYGSKPALANNSQSPISKNPTQNKARGVAQIVQHPQANVRS
jgi:hypothetical protein